MSEKNSDNTIIELEKVRKNAKKADSYAKHIAKKFSRFSNKNKKPVSRAMLIIIALFILIVFYIVADLSTGGVLSSVNGKFVSVITKTASANFSVSTNSDYVYNFTPYEGGYVILTENGISFINSGGDETAKQQLTYSSPAINISDSRIIVFDRGSNSYSLFRNESLYSQRTTENSIIDAAINSKNNYAIAVRDENAKCILYGYDANEKLIYQWNCPDGYISDVTMNTSGSKVAVTVVNSENATLSSQVYILDFDYDTAYAQFDYYEEIVIGSKFISNRKVLVITNKNVYMITGTEQEVIYSYGSANICYSSLTQDGFTAIVTDDHTHDDHYILTVFSRTGKLKYSAELNGKVKDVSSSSKSIAVLFDNKTETYSKTGKLAGTTTDINYNESIVINGNYLFVLSSDTVKRFAAYGESSAVYSYEDETF